MNPAPDTIELQHPTLRHLHWLSQALPLLLHERVAAPAQWMTPQARTQLQQWDRNPAHWPERLSETPPPRLGLYAERLYQCLMADLLGWELLAHNLPVRREGRTLGELDLLLRSPGGRVEHHELAVKFYLGAPDESGGAIWYGPNTRDRLDRKTDRLLNHQSRLAERPETAEALARAGLPRPEVARIVMPGYLFYPGHQPCPAPPEATRHHARGQWLPLSRVTPDTCRHWVPLDKPHWLGPWQQPQTPAPETVTRRLDQIARTGRPALFAALAPDADRWRETGRTFVVPDGWPTIDP